MLAGGESVGGGYTPVASTWGGVSDQWRTLTGACTHTHLCPGKTPEARGLTLAQDPSCGLGSGVPPGSGHPAGLPLHLSGQLSRCIPISLRAGSKAIFSAALRPWLAPETLPRGPAGPSGLPLSGPSEHRPHMSSPCCVTPPLLQPSQGPSRCQPDVACLGALGCLYDEQPGSGLPHQSRVFPPLGTSRRSPTGALEAPGGPHLPGCSECLLSRTHMVLANGDGSTSGPRVAV